LVLSISVIMDRLSRHW